MSRWRLETTAEFDRAARKLDRSALIRVKTYLDGLLELDDPRERGRRLTADLSGYWRLRIGDYRVIVEIHDDVLVLIAVGLGQRSEIYRKS